MNTASTWVGFLSGATHDARRRSHTYFMRIPSSADADTT